MGGRERFTLPYPPSANRYWKNWRGRMVISAEARQYKKTAWFELKRQGAVLFPPKTAISLTIWIFRPQRSGDLSNRIKVVEDAMQGAICEDDAQVQELHCYRGDDKENPRVEVEVEQWKARST